MHGPYTLVALCIDQGHAQIARSIWVRRFEHSETRCRWERQPSRCYRGVHSSHVLTATFVAVAVAVSSKKALFCMRSEEEERGEACAKLQRC